MRSDVVTNKQLPPWQKIPQASASTGLSQYFLRSGCKNGTIPHIQSGTTYLINVPLLLETLEEQARGAIVSL